MYYFRSIKVTIKLKIMKKVFTFTEIFAAGKSFVTGQAVNDVITSVGSCGANEEENEELEAAFIGKKLSSISFEDFFEKEI